MFKSTTHHKQRLMKVGAIALVGVIGSIAIFSAVGNRPTNQGLTTLAQNYQCPGVDSVQWGYTIQYMNSQDPSGALSGSYNFNNLRNMFGNPDAQTYQLVQQMLDTNRNGYLDQTELCDMLL